MKNLHTHLILIIDRSGSMSDLQLETIDTINNVVRAQVEEADEVVDLTVALFNTTVDILYDGVRLSRRPKKILTPANYQPDGWTALHDAVATVIDRVGQRLADTPESDRPSAVVVAILTDGLENASRRHTLADVAARIEHQQQVYNWQFMFLGANQDAWATGHSIGLDHDDAQSWSSTKEGMVALRAELDLGIKLRKERARK